MTTQFSLPLGYRTFVSCLCVVVFAACSGASNSGSSSDIGADRSVGTSDVGSGDQSVRDVDAGHPIDLPSIDAGRDEGAGLRDSALLAALRRDAESTMSSLGYNGARDAMYAMGGADDQEGRIECVYTGRTVDTDGSRTPSLNCELNDGTASTCAFNTEHTVPRVVLRERFGDGTPEYDEAEGDIHHLFPSDEQANNARGNFEFGETDCDAQGNCAFAEESFVGIPEGGSGPTNCPTGVGPGEDLCVMQVRAERRGDVARAVFYMSMRYEIALTPAVESVLRDWHVADPPDAVEVSRNDGAARAQGNRNPFVDEPTYVNRISDF